MLIAACQKNKTSKQTKNSPQKNKPTNKQTKNNNNNNNKTRQQQQQQQNSNAV